MNWIARSWGDRRRRRLGFRSRAIEVLEPRALLADGITVAAGPPLKAVAGLPISNAVFATFTVTDPFAVPGPNWRALINFGDGHSDGHR